MVPNRKVVTFSADVSDNSKRPQAAFIRGHPDYVPARHACPSKHGWQDTSFMRDGEHPNDEYLIENEKDHFLATTRARNSHTQNLRNTTNVHHFHLRLFNLRLKVTVS